MAVASPLARSSDTSSRNSSQARSPKEACRGHVPLTLFGGSLLKEFEIYGKIWIPLVEKFGGKHHGYFLSSEGTNNVALALFTFPSLAAYEVYRTKAAQDPDCPAAMRYYEETKCFLSLERSFFRPVFS